MHTQPQNADSYRNIWSSIQGHGSVCASAQTSLDSGDFD